MSESFVLSESFVWEMVAGEMVAGKWSLWEMVAVVAVRAFLESFEMSVTEETT